MAKLHVCEVTRLVSRPIRRPGSLILAIALIATFSAACSPRIVSKAPVADSVFSTAPSPTPSDYLSISFQSTVPASPSKTSSTPLVLGLVSGAGSEFSSTPDTGVLVGVYSDDICSIEIAAATRAVFESPGISISVDANSSTELYAKAVLPSGLASDCTHLTRYVHDTTAPVVSIGAPSNLNVSAAGTTQFNLSITGADSVNISAANIVLGTTGTASCSGLEVTGTGNASRQVTLSSCTGTGIISISVVAGVAEDLAGNSSLASGPSDSFNVDTSGPTIGLGAPSVSLLNGSEEVTFAVTYAGADTITLSAAQVELQVTGTVSCSKAISGTGNVSRTVTLSSCTGNGTAQVVIAAGSAADSAGNLAPASTASTAFTVDNTAPSVSSVAVHDAHSVDVTFSEALVQGATDVNNYTLSGSGQGTLGAHPSSVAHVSGSTYQLTWAAGEMKHGGDITITVANAEDAAGNAIGSPNAGTHSGGAIGTAPTITGLSDDSVAKKSKTWNWGCTESCTYRFAVDTSATWTASGTFAATATATQGSGTGTYYLHVQAQDAAGNVTAVTTVSAILDNTAPAQPSVLALQNPATSPSSVTTPTIRATVVAEANQRVKLYKAAATSDCTVGNLLGEATGSAGTIDITASALADGAYTLRAVAEDALGNASSCSTANVAYTVDSASVSVTGLANDPTSAKSKTWTWGCNKASCTYRFAIDTSNSWTPTGTFDSTVTASQSSGTGTYYLHVQAKDEAENLSSVSTVWVALDNTAPSAPSGMALVTPATSPGTSTTPTIRVSGVTVGDTISLHDADATCGLPSQKASGTAADVTIDLTTSALAEGAHSLYAKAADSAGNSSCTAAAISYTVDITAPTVSSATVQSGLTVDVTFSEAMGTGVTTAANYVVSGTGKGSLADNPTSVALQAGSTYRLTWASGEMKNGGDITITVSNAKDTAGNTIGAPNSRTHTGGAIGTAPTLSGLADDAVAKKSKTWSWSCSESCTYRFAIDTSGSWTPTGAYAATATATQSSGTGTYYIHVEAQDGAGNTSAVTTVSAVLDNTAPADASNLAMQNPAAATGNVATPTIRVTVAAETNLTVNLYNAATTSDCTGGNLIGTATGSGGTVDVTAGSALADGNYTFRAVTQDPAGNVSACSSASAAYALDTAAVTISGLSNDATATKSKTWTWGCNKASCTYRFAIDTSATWTAAGAYAATATATQNSGTGTYYLHVEARDAAGNVSSVSSVSAVLDNTAPAAPSGLSMVTPATASGNVTTPTIRVSGVVSGDRISLHEADATCDVASEKAFGTAADVTIDLTTSALAEGAHTFYAKAKDSAGNFACSGTTVVYTVDLTAPTVSGVAVQTGLTVDVTFSEPMGTGVTTASNYTLSGSGQGSLANNPTSVALQSGNTYRLTWAAGEMKNGGDITITVATAKDSAGNTIGSPDSRTHTGGAIGTAPTISGLSDDATLTKSKTWTWGCSESCTYRFAVDTSSSWTPTGTFAATATATQSTGNGTYYIHVQAQDGAGNLSAVTTVSVVLDNTAPTLSIGAPSQGTLLGASATATFTITYTGADSVSLESANVTLTTTDGASCVATASGSGTASRTVTLSSCSGTGTVAINIAAGSASDQAGNTAPAAGPSAAVNVAPYGAPAKLSFSVQPTNVEAGSSISPAIKVQVLDSGNNLVANSAAAITLAVQTNPGTSTLSGTNPKNAVAGEATFSDISLNKAGTGYVLRASSGALTTADSNAFNVAAAAATKLAFTNDSPTTADIDTCTGPFTLRTLDQNDNVAAIQSAITIDLTKSAAGAGTFYGAAECASALSPAQVTIASSGSQVQFWFKDNTGETTQLTASAGVGSGLSDATRDVVVSGSSPIGPIIRKGISVGNNAAGATTLVINKPIVFGEEGSFMLAVVTLRSGTTPTTITPPADWLLRQDNYTTTSSGLRQAIYYKVAGAAEPASYTFTLSASAKANGGILMYTGVNNTDPFLAYDGVATTASTSITAPSVNVGVGYENSLLLTFYGIATDASITPPQGAYYLLAESASTGGAVSSRTHGIVSGQYVTASGATGAKVGIASLAADNVGQTIVLGANLAPANPCVGKVIGEACGGGIYAGVFRGERFAVMPGGCDGTTNNPVCTDGADTAATLRTWRGTGGGDMDIPGVEMFEPATQASTGRGEVETYNITIHSSIMPDSAAHYCLNMVYGGYDDWYLPTKSELAYIYCKSNVIGGSHSTANPQETPNCTIYGGKTAEINWVLGSKSEYWVSTEYSNNNAWGVDFATGDEARHLRYNNSPVRCIRRF